MTTPERITFRAFGRRRDGRQVGTVGKRPDPVVLYVFPSGSKQPELMRVDLGPGGAQSHDPGRARRLSVSELGTASLTCPKAVELAELKLTRLLDAERMSQARNARVIARELLIVEALEGVERGTWAEIPAAAWEAAGGGPTRLPQRYREVTNEEIEAEPWKANRRLQCAHTKVNAFLPIATRETLGEATKAAAKRVATIERALAKAQARPRLARTG